MKEGINFIEYQRAKEKSINSIPIAVTRRQLLSYSRTALMQSLTTSSQNSECLPREEVRSLSGLNINRLDSSPHTSHDTCSKSKNVWCTFHLSG